MWDSASRVSWLKARLGKLATEQTVPVDASTLAALDELIALRGARRALPPTPEQPTSCSPNAAAAWPPAGCGTGSTTTPRPVSEGVTARPAPNTGPADGTLCVLSERVAMTN